MAITINCFLVSDESFRLENGNLLLRLPMDQLCLVAELVDEAQKEIVIERVTVPDKQHIPLNLFFG